MSADVYNSGALRVKLGFLGLAERAAPIREGQTTLLKWNIIGLKSVILSFFFPTKIDDHNLVFFLGGLNDNNDFRIALQHDQINVLEINMSLTASHKPGTFNEYDTYGMFKLRDTYILVAIPLRDKGLLLNRPGSYAVLQRHANGTQEKIGSFEVVLVDPLPLTPERIAAIRSTPGAAKSVRMHLGCKKCPAELLAYAALERAAALEAEQWQWYQSIPDSFTCTCGSTIIDLNTIRRNFHAMLGSSVAGRDQNIGYVPMYETQALENVLHNFIRLIEEDPAEEKIQNI